MVLIRVTARHKGVPEEAKDYAHIKADKLKYYFDRITKIEFVLERIKNGAQVEVIVSAIRGIVLVSKETNRDIFIAIELVASKMGKQLVKLKGKLRNRQTRNIRSKTEEKKEEGQTEETFYGGLEQEDWY